MVLCAIYHDCSEILTGDLPTPVKYHNPAIKESYKAIEEAAAGRLLRHDKGHDDIEQDARAVKERQQRPDHAHDGGVDAEIIRHAGADAAELFIRFGTVEPLFHEKSLLSSFLQGKV